MAIYIGSNQLSNIAIGSNELDKAYLSNAILWEKEGNLWKGTFNSRYYWSQSNLNNGQLSSAQYYMASQYYFPIKGGEIYHYQWQNNTSIDLRVIINEYAADGTYIDTVGNEPSNGLRNTDINWTTPSNCRYWTITYKDYYTASLIDGTMVDVVVLERV